MFNRKKYIAVTKNNFLRSQIILNKKSINFKTRQDLNETVSLHSTRLKNKIYQPFRLTSSSHTTPSYNAPTYDINIDFDLTNIPITAYDPTGNENDRPRINTFREDASFIQYLNAGGIYEDPITHVQTTPPWGDRSSGTFFTSIPVNNAPGEVILSAGVDVFAADYHTVNLVPSVENWTVTTSNPGEKKYQLLFNTAGAKNVSVTILSAEDDTPTETFAISAAFITGNAGTGWGSAWKFSTNGTNAVDRNGELDPADTYGGNRTLNFNMGDTIRFENLGINSTPPREEGRPFTIRNVSGVGTSDLAQGVVNNSSTLGPIFFTPVAPGTYYYNDSSDSSGGNGRNWGQIIIT